MKEFVGRNVTRNPLLNIDSYVSSLYKKNRKMETKIAEKLKQGINPENLKNNNGIIIYLNDQYIVGDNEKFMKMYNWISCVYDFAETVYGKIKYGDSIMQCRQSIMNRLEWRNDISVLYVSIGTGKDFNYMPATFDLKTIDFV